MEPNASSSNCCRLIVAPVAIPGTKLIELAALGIPAIATLPMNRPELIVINGALLRDWGLHLIDVNLTMGNLLEIVKDQTKSYLAR